MEAVRPHMLARRTTSCMHQPGVSLDRASRLLTTEAEHVAEWIEEMVLGTFEFVVLQTPRHYYALRRAPPSSSQVAHPNAGSASPRLGRRISSNRPASHRRSCPARRGGSAGCALVFGSQGIIFDSTTISRIESLVHNRVTSIMASAHRPVVLYLF